MAEHPTPDKPADTAAKLSQKGAHGGGNRFFQMTIRDAFDIHKRNQQPNIEQHISKPKGS
jgi:hypothetical protein